MLHARTIEITHPAPQPTQRRTSRFEDLFDQLRDARFRYEDARINGAPLGSLAQMTSELHEIRAEIARVRLMAGKTL